MTMKVTDGIKVIRLNSARINERPDPSFPFTLEVNFRPPEFMDFAFTLIHGGSEELTVQGKTKRDIDRFIDTNNLRRHPRFRWLKITGPKGVVEDTKR